MPQADFDLTGISVMLAMPIHRDLPWQTALSLVSTNNLFSSKGITLQVHVGQSSIIELGRSRAARAFLASSHTRLFWVDSDMVWDAEDFLRLVAFSTRMDVIGAVYCAKQDKLEMFLSAKSKDIARNEYGCLLVEGMGLGFTCVSRRVMEQLAAGAPQMKFRDDPEVGPHIFRCDTEGENFRGEDMAFFADIRELGYPVCIDPSIRLGHVGSKVYTARLQDSIETLPAPSA